MPLRFATEASTAYKFPLTIRHLLDSAFMTAADQEIVYRDQFRYTYREFFDRVGRLASALQGLGADLGMTVCHPRLLSARFAPMRAPFPSWSSLEA